MISPKLFDRTAKEQRESEHLANYAQHSVDSLGRQYAQPEDPLRTCYERDRDRVTHSMAFRRLRHKAQVFVSWEGDHNRTRLSHSLEVCQVARSVGSALYSNEPLCEALALCHDIGHPPFGHRGEWALDALMERQGDMKRIQSSVFLCENKASAIELKNMIEGWKAKAQLFEIVHPELEPEAIELGEI